MELFRCCFLYLSIYSCVCLSDLFQVIVWTRQGCSQLALELMSPGFGYDTLGNIFGLPHPHLQNGINMGCCDD